MRIYLAAAFSRQAEMKDVAISLQAIGVEITSRWLHEDQGMKFGNSNRKFMMRCALADLKDVDDSDVLVRFTDNLSAATVPSHLATGARMGETLYAIAKGKPVIVVGGCQNVFDYLPQITHLKTVKDLLDYFNPEEIN